MSDATLDPSGIQRSHRHTIMDGRVVTFALAFQETQPVGAFEVSASRSAVMVHRAYIRTLKEHEALIRALALAWAEHKRLALCDGRPEDDFLESE